MDKYSTITIRFTKEQKRVKITSDLKPEIVSRVIKKWQSLLDTTARIVNVPSGLIMRLNENTIEVFLKSNTNGNPYEVGEEANLIYGLYCETVIGTQQELFVPDATKSPVWKDNNPDVDINMVSYLGFPLNWPDGESFGTVCLLDSKEINYSKEFRDLLFLIKQHIESDLQLLMQNKELSKKNQQLEKLNSTKTKFLSLISHDIRGNVSSANEFLKLILEEFDDFDPAELKEGLTSINQSICSVFITLENLLSWSKEDLVQIKPKYAQVNIISILEELLNFFNQAIEMKRLKVYKGFYSKEAFVTADRKMLKVSLRNILSNAIKYTPKGGSVSIKVLMDNKKHKIVVEDTGVGMDKHTADSLFDFQVPKAEKKEYTENSAGIGLMLAKEFLDKNSASIKVESVLGRGTRFEISI